MSRFKRIETINAVYEVGAVPVFYHYDLATAKKLITALSSGGLKVLEFTNRGDFAPEVFSELAKFCALELPETILGAGSILDPGTASMFINSGANFIVGPVTNPDVAKVCNRRKIAYIPGCSTASEISYAEELGCEIIKVFPGSAAGGPGFIRDILAPMPWSSIMPTGGVDITRESLSAWFEAGACAVGIGSKLVSADLIKSKNWSKLEQRSYALTNLINELRTIK